VITCCFAIKTRLRTICHFVITCKRTDIGRYTCRSCYKGWYNSGVYGFGPRYMASGFNIYIEQRCMYHMTLYDSRFQLSWGMSGILGKTNYKLCQNIHSKFCLWNILGPTLNSCVNEECLCPSYGTFSVFWKHVEKVAFKCTLVWMRACLWRLSTF